MLILDTVYNSNSLLTKFINTCSTVYLVLNTSKLVFCDKARKLVRHP